MVLVPEVLVVVRVPAVVFDFSLDVRPFQFACLISSFFLKSFLFYF